MVPPRWSAVRLPPSTVFLWVLLLLGTALRLVGFTRGTADLSAPAAGLMAAPHAFHHFHPDEERVIEAALNPDLDPLHPSLTAYGALPVYLLRGALAATGVLGNGDPSLADPDADRRIYYLARGLAVAFSCGVLILVWAMGCRYFDRTGACLAVAIVALSPGAIQQAHYYIVDGLFVLVSAAALYASLRALDQQEGRRYAVAGALIGAAAAVRLNGLLLALVLVAGQLARGGPPERGWRPLGRRLLSADLWLAVGVALLVLVVLQPFLLTNPGLLWQTEGIDDFGLAVKIAQGKVLQPWTLVDVHSMPYVDHWALWALISSWPFALVFLLALVHALRLRKPPLALMVLWCTVCFLLVGQLPVRAVRYLVPMLPFLALFSGALLARAWQVPQGWLRLCTRVAVVALLGHLAFTGLSFTRVYLVEDSRIQAGRWLAQHVAPGTRIGIEGGGFSMQAVISSRSYQHVRLDAVRVFYTAPYLSCRAQLDLLREGLQEMEYIAITDVNRYAQFTAVPELYPVVAGCYQRLVAGELGFTLVQRFKTAPGLGGLTVDDQGAEPSFLGYDHPTVWVFRSTGPQGVGDAFARLEGQLDADPCCPDRRLRQAVALLAGGDWQQVKSTLRGLGTAHPDLALGHRLLVEVHRRLAETDSAAAALVRYRLPGWAAAPASTALMAAYASTDSAAALLDRYRCESPRTAHILHQATLHYIPSSTARSFVRLGLNRLALQVLKDGVEESRQYPPPAARQMAQSYLEVAGLLSQAGDHAGAEQAEALAADIGGR